MLIRASVAAWGQQRGCGDQPAIRVAHAERIACLQEEPSVGFVLIPMRLGGEEQAACCI
jgi:hypothetical protein